jgi:hypothetical protein
MADAPIAPDDKAPSRPPPPPTYVRFCPVNRVDAPGLDPVSFTGLFLKHLRDHFQPGEIENPQLAGLVWVPRPDDPDAVDPARTRILIEPFGYDVKENSGACPAVVVKRGAYDGSEKLGLGGNMWQGGWAAHPMPLAGSMFTRIIKCQHQITCETGHAGLTDLLAWEVYIHLSHFARYWCVHYDLRDFTVRGLAPASVEKMEVPAYAVAVTVDYAFTDTWVVAEVAPRLSRVTTVLKER